MTDRVSKQKKQQQKKFHCSRQQNTFQPNIPSQRMDKESGTFMQVKYVNEL